MKCKYCKASMSDLTNGQGAGRNYYCPDCGAHLYNRMVSFFENLYEEARWYTKAQWQTYVNTVRTDKEDWETNIERLSGKRIPYTPEIFRAWCDSRKPLKQFVQELA